MSNFEDYAVIEYNPDEGTIQEIESREDPDTPVNIHVSVGADLSSELTVASFYRSRDIQSDGWVNHGLLDTNSTDFDFLRRNDLMLPNEIIEDIEEKIISNTDIDSNSPIRALERRGLPDLIVWEQTENEIIDYFFCEVKTSTGGLSHAQLDWITRFDFLPIRVTYLLDQNEWDGHETWY